MKESVKLTQFAKSAGCAAKIGPKVLAELVGGLPKFFDEHLLVGTETNDDGAVYQISDELALIQTLDFFPPVVDEPSLFGEIAAANALSDIYAMGGTPKIALNIVAFPNCLGQEVLGEILQGGAKKVQEAGAVLAGGHSINDEEPKYGLSVTGFVNPKKMWKNSGATGRCFDSYKTNRNRAGQYGCKSGYGIRNIKKTCNWANEMFKLLCIRNFKGL